jgi:hypothetical protein
VPVGPILPFLLFSSFLSVEQNCRERSVSPCLQRLRRYMRHSGFGGGQLQHDVRNSFCIVQPGDPTISVSVFSSVVILKILPDILSILRRQMLPYSITARFLFSSVLPLRAHFTNLSLPRLVRIRSSRIAGAAQRVIRLWAAGIFRVGHPR